MEEEPLAAVPVDLSLSQVRVGSQNWDARFKTVNYISRVQALREARTAGEVVLLNEHREVASAARANIFWRRGKRLYTPAPEAGCRCGASCVDSSCNVGRWKREALLTRTCWKPMRFSSPIACGESFRARALDGRSLPTFDAANELRAEYGKATRPACLDVPLAAARLIRWDGSEPASIGQFRPRRWRSAIRADVSARDEAGGEIRLADFYRDGFTLIYFFPKANTPGCTAQACSLRMSGSN